MGNLWILESQGRRTRVDDGGQEDCDPGSRIFSE